MNQTLSKRRQEYDIMITFTLNMFISGPQVALTARLKLLAYVVHMNLSPVSLEFLESRSRPPRMSNKDNGPQFQIR